MKKDTSARRESPARMVAVMQNFAARNNEELFVSRGDKVQVLDDSKKWWKVRDQGGREGFVPASILQTTTPGGDAPSTQGAAGAVTSLGLSSSADDVTCWLQQQGHDTTLVDALSGLDGREILSLTRKELMEICGPADGQKLEKELRMLREK
ncbi:epidermal growth factor receptor kinase substrate 8-like protein 3 isoform X2 [Lampetra fluviatilis]